MCLEAVGKRGFLEVVLTAWGGGVTWGKDFPGSDKGVGHEGVYKIGVVKNFAKFIGNRLGRSIFFHEVVGYRH